MPLYELNPDSIVPVATSTFANAGLKERSDLQRLLREKIDVISPGTLVVSEEFGQFEESRRRIDLLGVDAEGNLVVIELKRTEDGGHMELQALRYSAMISTLTFERVVEIYQEHLVRMNSDGDARTLLMAHLGWSSPEDGEFAGSVRIVLASANFSKELTTTVLWLNDQGLDIRCVKLTPYQLQGRVLVDVQPLVPLPEAADYTIQIRTKRQESLRARQSQNRDFSKFILHLGEHSTEPLNKRRSMLEVFRFLANKGIPPSQVITLFPPGVGTRRYETFPGNLQQEEIRSAFLRLNTEGQSRDFDRYFTEPDEIMYVDGETYVLTKMWGITTESCLRKIKEAYPELGIEFEVSE